MIKNLIITVLLVVLIYAGNEYKHLRDALAYMPFQLGATQNNRSAATKNYTYIVLVEERNRWKQCLTNGPISHEGTILYFNRRQNGVDADCQIDTESDNYRIFKKRISGRIATPQGTQKKAAHAGG